jgi:hypothetical protein
MTRDPTLRTLIKRALQREASQNLAAGQHLIDGQWVPADTLRRARRTRRWTHLRQTIEALVLCALTALVGLAFMAIVVAIL